MTQARNIQELTVRMREIAHESELLNYIQKLFQAADDLEWRASDFERRAFS